MEADLLEKLANKSMTKEQLFVKVKHNYELISVLIDGLPSLKPAIRYGCGSVLMKLSQDRPDVLYPYMETFIDLLDSQYRILIWNALCIIANLARVDTENRFDSIFEKYYSFIENDYMVTVANVVGNSGKIALAKPYLTQRIVEKLLKVEDLSTTPHLSAECKRVIAQHTIQAFDMFYPQIEHKEKVIAFVKNHVKSSRKTLRREAEDFLKKWK